jgi:co-chaperonin GroES (HSP10)
MAAPPPSSSLPAPNLPARLAPGWASIYGVNTTQGINSKDTDLQFGQIIQLANGEETVDTVSVGQSVMFRLSDTKQVQYGSYYYYLMEQQKIILIENELT